MNSWFPYNNGRSIGIRSAEGGRIVRDEEHLLGARMTIKQGYKYVTVSCSIAGKIDHTRFFNGITAAKREYLIMQKELNKVIQQAVKDEDDSTNDDSSTEDESEDGEEIEPVKKRKRKKMKYKRK